MGIVDRAGVRRSRRIVVVVAGIAIGLPVATAAADHQPPPPPVLASPQEGTIADRLRPPLVIENATDPDGDALSTTGIWRGTRPSRAARRSARALR